MAIAMLVTWVALGLLVGVTSKWIAPARPRGWKRGGVAFAVGGGLVGNLLFSHDLLAMHAISIVGVGCGSLFVLGYALLLRSQIVQRTRDVEGVVADVPIEAGEKPLVKHEPTPRRY